MKSKTSITQIILIGLFAAIISVVSQIIIPLPTGVPVTLQTFIIPLCGFVLGWKLGSLSTITYLLIGLLGAPVFSGFSGGVGILFGKTGGFLIGFPLFALLAGLSLRIKNKTLSILLGIAGLLIDHLFGVLQFGFLMNLSVIQSAILVSIPYLMKDILFVIGAYFAATAIRKALLTSNIASIN